VRFLVRAGFLLPHTIATSELIANSFAALPSISRRNADFISLMRNEIAFLFPCKQGGFRLTARLTS
jgi:hypothetical protein